MIPSVFVREDCCWSERWVFLRDRKKMRNMIFDCIDGLVIERMKREGIYYDGE